MSWNQVSDSISVLFRNNASVPFSIHPHGVFYSKDNEGASCVRSPSAPLTVADFELLLVQFRVEQVSSTQTAQRQATAIQSRLAKCSPTCGKCA